MGSFLRNVIVALIGLGFLVLAFYLVIWVLGMFGIIIPANILKVIFVLGILFFILFLYDLFVGGRRWFPFGTQP